MANETASRQPPTSPSLTGSATPAGAAHRELRDVGNLSSFAFLMSAHRLPVCMEMLLGDNDYLRRQLRLACTTVDEPLRRRATAMLRELAAEELATAAGNPWSH